MKATFKVKVLEPETPPVPPFVGTKLRVRVTDDQGCAYGINKLWVADGADGTVSWGDGVVETFPSETSPLTHVYAKAGEYEIRLSENVSQMNVTGSATTSVTTIYAENLLSFVSNSPLFSKLGAYALSGCLNLTEFDVEDANYTLISASMMKGCANLPAVLRFPCITTINSNRATLPFAGCTSVREIWFPKSAEDLITRSISYQADPHLGAPNAEVKFF